MKKTLSITSLCCFVLLVLLQEANALNKSTDNMSKGDIISLYDEANLHYQKKEYDKALFIYKQLEELPLDVEAWEIYYNTANTYYRLGKYSKAMLYFEKAERIAPHKEEIRKNIALCKTKLADKTEQMPEFILNSFWQNFIRLMPPTSWAIISCGLSAIFLFSILAFLIGRAYFAKRMAFWSSITSGVLLVFVFCICITSRINRYRQEAIVMSSQSEIKASPEPTGKTKYLIHEGGKVKILDYIEPYYKVKMSDGNQGWISAADIEKI